MQTPAPNHQNTIRHRWLYALPESRLPATVSCNRREYSLTETFKHDFFAATGRYECDGEQAVLKVGRVTSFFGLPLQWTGKFLCNREVRLYKTVQGLPGVPKLIGTTGPTGFLHEFVPGHALERREAVSDTFFDELFALLDELHTRDIAYVDLNKRQNILMGDDGKPYLIDFQISLYFPKRNGKRAFWKTWLLKRFQHEDIYHVLKHKRRLRPDLLTEKERKIVENISFWIKFWRVFSAPLRNSRRWILRQLNKSEKGSVEGSSAK